MLPDFPLLKAKANKELLRFVRQQMPIVAPILSDISTFVLHEGTTSTLTRADSSTDATQFTGSGFKFEMPREEMRTNDMDALHRRLLDLAEQVAEHQSRTMLARIGEAAESVGNAVDAGGDFRPEHLLETMRQVHVDFDPSTGKQRPGLRWVMHPDTAKKVMAKVAEWEQDPDFMRALRQVEEEQKEAWRARESRRVLAD